jgi:hypothetical protein
MRLALYVFLSFFLVSAVRGESLCEKKVFSESPRSEVENACVWDRYSDERWDKYFFAIYLVGAGEAPGGDSLLEVSDEAIVLMREASDSGVLLARIFLDVAMVVEKDAVRAFGNWIDMSRALGAAQLAPGASDDLRLLTALGHAQKTLLGQPVGPLVAPSMEDWFTAKSLEDHYVQASLWILASYSEVSFGDISMGSVRGLLEEVIAHGGRRSEIAKSFIAKIDRGHVGVGGQ